MTGTLFTNRKADAEFSSSLIIPPPFERRNHAPRNNQCLDYVLIRLCHFFVAGKLQNIEGIEKSTEDDINKDNIEEIEKSTTEDYHYKIPSPVPAVKKAPKPKTIPQGKT